ncbi:MAG: hypothetical protein ACREJ4_11545 [Candidatus Methylomirabilaceae bacterium]
MKAGKTTARVLRSPGQLRQDLQALETEVNGWLTKLAQPGVTGSYAVGMITMAFGHFEELLRWCLFLTMRRYGLDDGEVATAAHVIRKPLEKQSLGSVIACLRAVRTLRPGAAYLISDARLKILDGLASTRNQRLKAPHSKAQRKEALALAPEVLREIQAAMQNVLAPLAG